MSRRMEQVSSVLHRAIAAELSRALSDPRFRGLVTVTGIKVAGDLKNATVRVTVLPEEHETLTLHALESASGAIRRRVMEKVALRDVPQFRFVLDEGVKHQQRVSALLSADRSATAPTGGGRADHATDTTRAEGRPDVGPAGENARAAGGGAS